MPIGACSTTTPPTERPFHDRTAHRHHRISRSRRGEGTVPPGGRQAGDSRDTRPPATADFGALVDAANLSAREQLIVEASFDGHDTNAIAAQLGVSPNTIRTYRKRILHKTGASSMREIVLDLLKRAWGSDDEPLSLRARRS